MCGIFGCVISDGRAAPLIHQALRRLEYRGYDSVGEATIFNGRIYVKKDAGKIEEVHKAENLDDLPGLVGIGHTRWATHGAPSKINAHPHLDCTGSIALVHNGVIENFTDLKEELLSKGHIFVSKTDSEAIVHLIEEEVKAGGSFTEAVSRALKRLEGSYAVAAICTYEPDIIVCARRESPLILGIKEGSYFCASDISAFLPLTKNAIALDDGEMAILRSDRFEIRKIDDYSPVDKKMTTIDWDPEMAEKHGYPHYMLKEIHEQPRALRNALRLQEQYLDLMTTFLDRAQEVFLVAAGTSYHACLAASYMFSKLAMRTTYPVIASEFIEEYGKAVNVDTTILFVSQSGETADTLEALEYARNRASTILGLTNVIGSTLTRVARAYICQQSGPEIGVAATKTFTSQLLVLAQLSLRLAKKRGKISQAEIDYLEEKIMLIPEYVEKVIKSVEDRVIKLAEKYHKENMFLFLGRGISSATSLEGRLKLMEISYKPSLSFPAGESKHGPISLVEKGTPVVFICPKDETHKVIKGNIMEMKARGATVIAIVEEGDEEIKSLSDDYIEVVSGIPSILSPIVYVVPLQLFAYYVAVLNGLDPDKPRNLAKSVTVK
ncbi:MAG: glutamine--fructose-6-phosphate transaminase (isomerizing) [Candidatus Bathyarchaeia archaeon]